MAQRQTDNNDRVCSLKLRLEEERRDLDMLNEMYRTIKVKNITFLAAALALLGYLYTSTPEGGSSANLKDKLFIPDEPYGVIIYAFSLGVFLISIAILLFALKPRTWSTPHDEEQEECVSEDYERYLEYMHRRSLRCIKINSSSYSKVQALLDISFLPLVLGGIMLLILKTFGG